MYFVTKMVRNGALIERAQYNNFLDKETMMKEGQLRGYKHDKPCTDHLGNRYPNIKAMCSRWDILPETFTRRINVYGMSLEETLTSPVKHNGGQRCSDHTGKRYRSRSSMCRQWGIERKLFEYRISHGWSLEDALTRPSRYVITTGC